MKAKPIVWFVIIAFIICSLSLSTSVEVVEVHSSLIGTKVGNAATTTITKSVAHESIVLRQALQAVCSCESDGRRDGTPHQFNADGTVVRGKINKNDIGECQINAVYHEVAAKKMGMDIYTKEGNIAYANYLYDTQGLTPWNWSRSCWQ